MRKVVFAALIAGFVGGFFADAAFATPYCADCPFDCYELGLGKKECSEIEGSRGSCCVDLTQRGLDVARAFDRARGSRDRGRDSRRDDREERCPPGFSPSEQKCSPDERRRGCKDVRLPNGLGCVRR